MGSVAASIALVSIEVLTSIAVSGCGSRPPSEPNAGLRAAVTQRRASAEALAPPPPRDDGRLAATATPEGYTVQLTIDPAKPRFFGVTTILVDVPKATPFVILHGRDLHVTRAAVRSGTTDFPATVTNRVTHGGMDPEELVLAFESPVPAGAARIELTYDAPFAPDLTGLYRVKEGGRDYAFTQFEATDARRAFPCFDEPGFKTPYDVTITAPRAMTALANSVEDSHADAPDGMVTHAFRTTAPLPTYLVAFAVGTFDILDGPTDPVPIRLVTTHGSAAHAALGQTALGVASSLLAKLSEYFGMKYPYSKLDLVAVPDFDAGAMENPGLVTFRDTFLLLDPQHATTGARRGQAEVIAHELAHQWLGDLVTMRWWDDLWLNEGFATWAEAKVVDAWNPAFGATIEQIAGIDNVLDADALRSARAVRQPVRSTGEAKEAFDGITYEKGAAVLRMLEGWLGPDTFRRGIHHYLQDNAWKNAGAEDLFKALDFVSTQKVGALANGFLDQAGVPEVVANWNCKTDKFELHEEEWRPLGEPASEAPHRWTLPVCIASDLQKSKSCFTLGKEPITRTLGGRCPAWVYPNAGLGGYFRFLLDRPKLLALARAARSLDTVDRLGLVSNAWAAVRQGAVDPGLVLDLLPTFDGEGNRYVQDEVMNVLGAFDHTLVEDDIRPAFQRYVASRLGASKRALGWEAPSSGSPEDDDRKLQRRSVLWAMGELAGDRSTLDEAEAYAVQWLGDATSVSNDIAAIAVPLASIRQGAARLLELRAAAISAKRPQDRILALRAMGMFDDPAVLRAALDLTLTDEVKLSELNYVVGPAEGRRERRASLYAWAKDQWPAIRARFPGSLSRGFVGIASSACTSAERDDTRAFFASSMQGVEGMKRPLDQAFEGADLCVALREHGASDVTSWLTAWRKAHPG
jgi:alanyl aminopeptidase